MFSINMVCVCVSVLCAFDGGQFETMVENVAQAARRQAGHNEIKKKHIFK